MVDWYGRWTYEPNTPEEKKCDMDRLADWVTSTGFEPQTNIENVCWMILGHFLNELEQDETEYCDTIEDMIQYVRDSGGIEEFDYYC